MEITVEKSEKVVVTRQRTIRGYCSICGKESELMTADEAAYQMNLTAEDINTWVKSGRTHGTMRPDGLLLVCCESL